MEQIINGILISVVAAILVFVGSVITTVSVYRDCAQVGQSRLTNGYVIECKVRERK